MSRVLDDLVARKIMKKPLSEMYEFEPSTNMTDAWRVVKAMLEPDQFGDVRVFTLSSPHHGSPFWRASMGFRNDMIYGHPGVTPEEAICLTALAAKEAEEIQEAWPHDPRST